MFEITKPWICTRCASSLSRSIRRLARPPAFSTQRRTYADESPKERHRNGKPFRMAVIGSGPAGFYTAYKVMSKIETAKVDMFEQLPVPFGLVRFGVAPDHPEVKNCQQKFTEVAESPRFNFIGNVPIGEGEGAVPLRQLYPHYDAIVFAYGASKDRTLGIPGEEILKGIYSARAFVGWYNGLPEYAGLEPDLTQSEEAVVIGQGNVALDVARILLQDVNVLRTTDITEHAIQVLEKSKVKRVRVVGRRGPLQASFTIKEIRELMKLPSVAFHPVDKTLIPENIKSLPRPTRRIMEVLLKGSEASVSTAPKSWSLDFCLSPTAFIASEGSPSQLGGMSFEKTTLSPNAFDLKAKAIGSGESVGTETSLAFRSIGYKSEALPTSFKSGENDEQLKTLPFDNSTGTIPNDHLGRVLSEYVNHESEKIEPSRGLYCAGWVKRGPTGVIASTMEDAFATAESIERDWYGDAPFLQCEHEEGLGKQGVDGPLGDYIRNACNWIDWNGWKTIDKLEKERGLLKGKEREKITNVEEMIQASKVS